MSLKNQGSLEYIIIIGGVIVLAAATYFILRGFSETTGEGTTEQIGVVGDKFRLELENIGRSETRFFARSWGSLPYLSMLAFNNTGTATTTSITIYNLTDYGLNLDELEFAYNDSGAIETLGYTVEGSSVTVTTQTLPTGSSEILIFHNNSSALELDDLNYTSSDPDVNITGGTSPVQSPDTTPPTILISSTAYGVQGSVKDADIQVTVSDTSLISETYFSIDNSPYFRANNIYYGFQDITIEGHPEDFSYDSASETIHIIATVPSEDNYTVRVRAVDVYSNAYVQTQEVSIVVGTLPTDADPPVILTAEPINNSLLGISPVTINISTDETALCKYATSPGIPYDDMYFFTQTGSTLHRILNVPLQDGVNYRYFFRCRDLSDNTNAEDYFINFTKSGTDSTPPAIIDSDPANNSIVTESPLTITLITNENAECRNATIPGLTYGFMTPMDVTGYTTHQLSVTLVDGVNYKYYFKCNDSNGRLNDTDYLLNFTKSIGGGTDTTPPVLLATQPANNSKVNYSAVTINLTTNEDATCKYATSPGTSYPDMYYFAETGLTIHRIFNIALSLGESYVYFFKCNDTSGNANPSDYLLNFTRVGWGPDVELKSSFNNVLSGFSLGVNGDMLHLVSMECSLFDPPPCNASYINSSDGGATWSNDSLLMGVFPIDPFANTLSLAVHEDMLHLVWLDQNPSGPGCNISYKNSSDVGTTWSDDYRLVISSSGLGSPHLAASDNDLHVVWSDYRDSNYEIYYMNSSDGGTSWSNDLRLTYDSASSYSPRIAVNGSNLHLVWSDDRDGDYEIYYINSSDGGITWTNCSVADCRLTDDLKYSFIPSVAVSGNNLHVLWEEYDYVNSSVYYMNSSDGGITWSAPYMLMTYTLPTSATPSLAASGDDVYAAWTANISMLPSTSYRVSRDGGTTWSSEHTVGMDYSFSLYPVLAASGNDASIVWGEYQVYGDSPQVIFSEIYHKKYYGG